MTKATTAPSTKPYRAIATDGGDEDGADKHNMDSIVELECDATEISTAHLMIERELELNAEAMAVCQQRQRESRRFKFVMTSIILVILIILMGGRDYHYQSSNALGGGDSVAVSDNEKDVLLLLLDSDDDFFVPLTAKEREDIKEMLRSTLRETKYSLLDSTSYTSSRRRRGTVRKVLPQRTLILDSDLPKQFMHMHHMKTGGTSLDGLIGCSIRRQNKLLNGTSINYSSMSECGPRVKTCMDDLARQLNASVVDNVFYHNKPNGTPQLDAQYRFDPADETLQIPIDDLNVCTTSEANIMSYCASLHTVRTFGWKDVDKITIIRNPVDRAWSMYRFQLSSCYKCQELKDVLRKLENGTFGFHGTTGEENASPNFVYEAGNSCAVQLIGHQATNLLSSIDLYNIANDVRFPMEREIVKEAVRNLRKEFTWIGITDRIQESIDGIRSVFPFLSENLTETVTGLQHMFAVENERFALPDDYVDDVACVFEHKNAGRDPTCGTTSLDNETIALIEKLNHRDVAVYKAAVERFELQMEVLDEYKNGYL